MAQHRHELNVMQSRNAPRLASSVSRTRAHTGASKQLLALAILSRSTQPWRMRPAAGVQNSALSSMYCVASSQLILRARTTCGSSSVSSMAYQAPLPPRACSKAWAHHLCVYNRTQCTDTDTAIRLGFNHTARVVEKPRSEA